MFAEIGKPLWLAVTLRFSRNNHNNRSHAFCYLFKTQFTFITFKPETTAMSIKYLTATTSCFDIIRLKCWKTVVLIMYRLTHLKKMATIYIYIYSRICSSILPIRPVLHIWCNKRCSTFHLVHKTCPSFLPVY